MNPDDELQALAARFPLPCGYGLRDRLLDSVNLEGSHVAVAGFIAEHSDIPTQAIGAAAAIHESPVARAYYELVERICIQGALHGNAEHFTEITGDGSELGSVPRDQVFPENPLDTWRWSVTNGVALHETKVLACRSARMELIERDAIMRAWLGHCSVAPVPRGLAQRPAWLPDAYRYQACAHGVGNSLKCLPAVVASLALPKNPDQDPLVLGLGTGNTLKGALESSQTEMLQRMAFLWDEPIPRQDPEFSPTPDFHQDYYLNPAHHSALIEFWTHGHEAVSTSTSIPATLVPNQIRFVDITPTDMPKGLFVVRAFHSNAVGLRFGLDPRCRHLPDAWAVHPIC